MERSQDELNEEIERESLENHEIRNNNNHNHNGGNDLFNISSNNRSNMELFNNFQHRMRLLNALLAHRRRLILLNQQLNNNFNNVGEDDNIINVNFNFLNEDINANNNNEELINNLPVFKVDEKFMEKSQKEDNKIENFEKCVICMEKYKINEDIKTLPCFHIFHKDCIEQWLKAGKDTCPICKNKVNNNDLGMDFNDE